MLKYGLMHLTHGEVMSDESQYISRRLSNQLNCSLVIASTFFLLLLIADQAALGMTISLSIIAAVLYKLSEHYARVKRPIPQTIHFLMCLAAIMSAGYFLYLGTP